MNGTCLRNKSLSVYVTNACNCCDCAELVNYISRKEVDVVIVQVDSSILDALTTQLVQFSVFDPLNTLRYRWLMQIQLQFFH